MSLFTKNHKEFLKRGLKCCIGIWFVPWFNRGITKNSSREGQGSEQVFFGVTGLLPYWPCFAQFLLVYPFCSKCLSSLSSAFFVGVSVLCFCWFYGSNLGLMGRWWFWCGCYICLSLIVWDFNQNYWLAEASFGGRNAFQILFSAGRRSIRRPYRASKDK